jgi:hypothetical protein
VQVLFSRSRVPSREDGSERESAGRILSLGEKEQEALACDLTCGHRGAGVEANAALGHELSDAVRAIEATLEPISAQIFGAPPNPHIPDKLNHAHRPIKKGRLRVSRPREPRLGGGLLRSESQTDSAQKNERVLLPLESNLGALALPPRVRMFESHRTLRAHDLRRAIVVQLVGPEANAFARPGDDISCEDDETGGGIGDRVASRDPSALGPIRRVKRQAHAAQLVVPVIIDLIAGRREKEHWAIPLRVKMVNVLAH